MEHSPQAQVDSAMIERAGDLMRYAHSVEIGMIDDFEEDMHEIQLELLDGNVNSRNVDKVIGEIVDSGFGKSFNEKENISLIENEGRFLNKALINALGADITKSLDKNEYEQIDSRMLVTGTPVDDWWDAQTEKVKYDVAREIRLGMAAGEEMPDIAARLGGVLKLKESTISTIARTLVMSATSAADEEFFKKNDDIIQGYVQLSTLDSRTTMTCATRDRKGWDKDKKPVGHDFVFILPPLHPNCRSRMGPWLYDADEIPIEKRAKLSRGTRASMDGQVEAEMDFEEWIDGKSDEFQKEWFGPGRYELYMKGKIRFQDLVDPEGRPLTIEDLEKKYE